MRWSTAPRTVRVFYGEVTGDVGGLTLDERCARYFESQHGLITVRQARRCGATPADIRARARHGRWARAQRRVYRLVGVRQTPKQAMLAVILASRRRAVVSHRSAGWLRGLEGFAEPDVVEVTVPRCVRLRVDDAVVHQSPFAKRDWDLVDGIRVMKVPRTIADLAAILEPPELRKTVRDAARKGKLTLDQAFRILDDRAVRGRPGIQRLRDELKAWMPGIEHHQSNRETWLFESLQAAGLPLPEPQVVVRLLDGRRRQVDFAYRDLKLAIEYEGEDGHRGWIKRQEDGVRQNELVLAGWTPLLILKCYSQHDAAAMVRLALETRSAG